MGQFHDVDCGASVMTREELDRVAVERAGVLGSIGYGYAVRGALPEKRHGYGFRWINTQGMGNHGRVVLLPRSARAAELLRQGRVRQLENEFQISHSLAMRIELAQRGVQRGRESSVIKCVINNMHSPGWSSYPGCGGGVWQWCERWDIDPGECTAPRLDAVAQIVKRLKGA